jgi:hypothetical protein
MEESTTDAADLALDRLLVRVGDVRILEGEGF